MMKRASRSRSRRTETVAFRVSSEERQRLEDGAIEAGMTLSAYLAGLLDRRESKLRTKLADMKATRPAPLPPPLPHECRPLPPEVIYEFKRIGNNLNQIAHAVNSGLPPETRHMSQQFKLLLDLIVENDLQPPTSSKTSKPVANDGPQTSQARQEFQRRV